MSSFININNRDSAPEAKYSAEVIKAALLVSETKSTIKADSLTKNIEESLSLNEALELFTDKLKAVKSLTESSHIIALKEAAALEVSKTELTLEGTMSEIHMLAQEAKDIVDFTKKFFKEFGDKIKKSADSTQWVESLYTDAVSEDHSENPNDIYDVRPCDKAGTPWSVWEGDVQVKCFETEEEAEAYATEQNKEQGLTEEYDGNMSDFKYEFPMRFEEETGNSPKAIKKMAKQGKKGYEVRTSTYMSQTEMEKVGLALGLNLKSYTKGGSVAISVYESTIVTNEAFSRMSSDTIGNELYSASQELSNYYGWLKAGNDSGKGKTLDSIISLLKKCKNDIKKFNTKEETIGTKYEAPVVESNVSSIDEAKTISFAKASMMGSKLLNKISIGTILDTKGGQYEITGFGQQSNAFKEFEATIDGKEVKVKLTVMYGLKLEVTDDVRSARFNKEEEVNSIILESVVNEGRSINKIQTEWSQTTTNMVQKVADWKAAEGDRKIELLEELKSLTAKKKELEIELDAKVAGKDKDVKLAIEGNAFESVVTEGKSEVNAFLAMIAKDYQFDKKHDDYTGFLNTDPSDMDDVAIEFINNVDKYKSLMKKHGLSLQSGYSDKEAIFVKESVITESFVAYTENSKGEYEVVKVLKDQRAAKAWRKKNAYLLDDDSVDVKSIGTTPKKDWDKTHPELATESVVNEAKFKKGQYIKAKKDSDNFDGDVYDKTNDVDGSEILKNSSFEIYEIGKDEVILWSDADEVEYSIDPDDLKNFVKESVVNEAKAVKVTKKEWPYVEFKIGSKKHKVEFDYEDIIDNHGNEGQDQYWLGKDDDGKEWSIDVYADYNGDVQDVHYDTIVAESVVTDKPSWDNLLEEFEIVETTNEDIRSDVKKWIRTNKEELNDLADADEWDAMYDKLYSEFGVEADSIKAKDLLKTFQFVF